MIDTFVTSGIQPPRAFRRLRRELQAEAGGADVAAVRTRAEIDSLRHRAAHFAEAMEVWRGQPLGDWYMTLASRMGQTADELEADAMAAGILGGAA